MTNPPSPATLHKTRTTHGTYLLAVILVLSLGAGAGLSPQATAQTPLDAELTGTVSDLSGFPLPDVTVTAKKQITGSTWHYHETWTDASGQYAFEGLGDGSWNLSFQKDGYKTQHVEIQLTLNTSEEHDVSLRSIIESTLRGTVYDSETGDPLAEAKIRVNSWNKEQLEERNTSSDENGDYEIPLFPGENEILITKKGYSNQHDWAMGGQGDVVREAWLWPTPEQNAATKGRVVDQETGEGVIALVSLRPDYDRAHHSHSGTSGSPSSASSDAISEPAYSPAPHYYQNHNSTVTDEDGYFRMDAHAGHVVIEANREGYLIQRVQVELEEDATKNTDMELEPLPERTVTLSGSVKNAKNGSVLHGASVSVQVPGAGDNQWTQTDENGRWEVQVRPGYTVVEVHYWGGPVYMVAEEDVSHDAPEPSSSEGGLDDMDSESVPEPADPEPPREDSTRYYPAVRTLTTQEDGDHSLDVELHPEREATTTIVGYVVDTQTNEAVAGAHVSLQNHETSAWGSTTTDEHGSFRFETHGGYHTLRVHRNGYLYTAVNTIAPDSGTHRVDLEAHAGQWADSGWWSPDGRHDRYHYGGGDHDAGYAEADSMASDDSAGSMDEAAGGRSTAGTMASQPEGSAALQGSAGGLGPYQGPQDEQAPAPGILLVLLVGTLALALVRRRRS